MLLFRELAAAFQKLEHTSSSTGLVAALAEFLSRLDPDEAKAVAYLLRGELAAPFEAQEIGIAGRMAARAVAEAYAVSQPRVEKLLATAGDLGVVAEHLAGGKRGRKATILHIFDQLKRIARISGSGSQKQKCERLAALLSAASGGEAKYILRTVLGTLRLGVADMTFLRALAKAYTGSVKNKADVEAAYNVLSDLGELSRRMAHADLAGLRQVAPVPGTPIRMMLASRVRGLQEVPLHMSGKMFVEYKYDGERVQIHRDRAGKVQAFSRRQERITHQYPEIVAAFGRASVPNSTILEGEIVAFDAVADRLLPFQMLMQRRRKHEILAYMKKVPVALFVFDLLMLKSRSLLNEPLSVRRRLLEASIMPSRLIHLSSYTASSGMTDVRQYFRKALAYGAEGVVIKSAEGPYQAGKRGWLWIKFKREYQKQPADTFDLVVVGALHGKGYRAGGYGSLLLASFDPATNKYYTLTKVGAGFSGGLLHSLPKLLKPYVIAEKHWLVDTGARADIWFEPVKVVEVEGAELTVSPIHTVAHRFLKRGGLALRFPRFIRFRDDKSAEQATSVREIYDMYRSAEHARRK